jgi:hypothetical protein
MEIGLGIGEGGGEGDGFIDNLLDGFRIDGVSEAPQMPAPSEIPEMASGHKPSIGSGEHVVKALKSAYYYVRQIWDPSAPPDEFKNTNASFRHGNEY